jgi:glycerophosphoryl diester phosphodiesterase
VVCTGGCSLRWLPADWESPGRLKVADLSNSYTQFDSLCVGDCKVLPCDNEKAERVGHVLGAYQEYTMKLTKEGPLPRKNATLIADALCLMERAFDKMDLDAVEFDVHVNRDNKNDNRVFILHYEPLWAWLSSWSESKNFIEKDENTLEGLLSAFFLNYSGKRKRLYIELKAPKKCRDNGMCPTDSCTKAVKPVAAVVKKWSMDIKNNEDTIAFVSFSTQMLEAIYTALPPKLREVVDFILILGPSNWGTAIIASIPKGWIPDFDQDVIKWLKQEQWVDGVWYSPRVIKNLPTQICEINSEREKNLFVGISTYQQGRDDFMKSVRESWSKPSENFPYCGFSKNEASIAVRSFIFDIDSQ